MLRRIQRHLERLYEIEAQPDVGQFLLTDADRVAALEGPDARSGNERLLLADCGDELHMTLYVDAGILARLSRDDPFQRLHSGNIGDFWVALEGVSHFLYAAWRAGHDRRMSLLELEMQAEVDKYVLATDLQRRQRSAQDPRRVHRLLFEHYRLDPALAAPERERYHRASRYAGKYCRRLPARFPAARGPCLRRELRRFYRLPQADKIRHIEAA